MPKKIELRKEGAAPAAKKAAEPEKKELYKEEMHRFTPVFIPPPVDKSAAAASDDDAVELDEDGKAKKSDSKKRLGGLATLMSGKRPIINKSQTLLEEKTEFELKTYALGSLGKPIYTQIKKKKNYSGPADTTQITEVKESKRVVTIHKIVKANDLAQKLSVKFEEMLDKCLEINLLVKPTDHLGLYLATLIANLFGYRVEDRAFDEDKVLGATKEAVAEKKKNATTRAPIITIMGHVDHGKTTLLDSIRKAKVADGEAGGITQHIGAYSVTAKDKMITFLDTPGHAAFAAIRQRGADVTDIVVLVVAADDGVMPQTKESINFCKQAKKPIIVAVNKMDKEGVNPDRIKQELAEFELTPEEWGGDTQFVPVSALQGTGIDGLLDSILLQAEMMELGADPKLKASGVVIESKIEQGRGPVATILIQDGTLNKGDNIVVGETYGRARSLTDHTGAQLSSAGPSTPVQVLGLEQAPSPGDTLYVVKNEREAKKVVDNRIQERKNLEHGPTKKLTTLEDFFGASVGSEEEVKKLNLVVRSDVQGSFEAIKSSLEALSNREVEVKVIGGGVGPISDSDVNFAKDSGAFLVGFNMRPVTTARRLAEDKGVDVKTYSIIYELINDIKLALEGMLTPNFVEQFVGRAEIREVFNIPKIGAIAGCMVVDGKIEGQCKVRLLRSGKIIHDGKLSSLKRFKDDVKEVKNGLECGMALENFNDLKVGDIFEAYIMQEKKRTLQDVGVSGTAHGLEL